MLKEPRHEKVSIRGPEYRKEREYIELQRESYAENTGQVFGKDYIDSREKLKEAKLAGIDPSVSVEKLDERLNIQKIRLADSLKRAWNRFPGRLHVLRMFSDLYENPRIHNEVENTPEIKRYFDGTYRASLSQVSIIMDRLPNDELNLSKKLVELIAECNVERFEQKQAVFEESVKRDSAEFLTKISELVKNRVIKVDIDEITQRIAEVKFVMSDGIGKHTENLGGYYHPEFDTIGLVMSGLSSDGGYPKNVIFHELFHLTAGRTLLNRYFSEHTKKERVENGRIIRPRSGLRFNGKDRRLFGWLDEAVTERCTAQIDVATAYEQERKLLDLICTKGAKPIPMEMFYDAYFENYDPNTETKIPAWKSLSSAINEAYAPGFLSKLDEYIKLYGVDRACSQMRNDWQVIVELTHTAKTIETAKQKIEANHLALSDIEYLVEHSILNSENFVEILQLLLDKVDNWAEGTHTVEAIDDLYSVLLMYELPELIKKFQETIQYFAIKELAFYPDWLFRELDDYVPEESRNYDQIYSSIEQALMSYEQYHATLFEVAEKFEYDDFSHRIKGKVFKDEKGRSFIEKVRAEAIDSGLEKAVLAINEMLE